jgi:hypothetical protein
MRRLLGAVILVWVMFLQPTNAGAETLEVPTPRHIITCSVFTGEPVRGSGPTTLADSIGGSAGMECTPNGPELATLEACLAYGTLSNSRSTAVIIKSTCDFDLDTAPGSSQLYATPLGACARSGYYWTVIVSATALHGSHNQTLDHYVFSQPSYISCGGIAGDIGA